MNGQGKLLTHYLKNADKLIIPVYQRNYDWREEHCRKLYQDLVRTIRDRKRWHFFGGIVSVSDPMGSSSDYLVIDGQQRITTVSLLLLAMANLIKEGKVIPEDDDLYAQITKKYLVDEINPRKRKVKLKPIKGDQDAYDRLWGDPADFDRSSNITQNYLFFYNEIQKQAITIDQLFKAVEKLQIIDITLTPPDDDPQLVFESLNSTGLELNEGDKIRNFVLMGLDIEEQERFYDSYWNPIEKNAGYNKQNNSYDVSPFIRDYLSIKQKKITGMKDIYTEFKAYAEKMPGEMESIMKDLLGYAKRYNKLLLGHPSFPAKLKASLFRLNRFESSVTRPFLMEVMRLQESSLLNLDEVAEICRIVESYLLRRIICDLPSNTLAKVFLTMSSDIKRFDGTYSNFIEKMKYVLTSKKEKAAFPDNETFADCLRTKNIYANKAYLNYLADADDSVDLSIQVTRSPDEFSSSVKIDDDIYIWTGTATQYKVNLLRKFFEQYKQDPSDLVFFLDDSKGIGSDEEIERYKIRRKYWESVLPSLQEATGTFLNISPSKNNSIMGATARSGVYLCCVANYDSARVEIFIDQGDYQKNRAIYKRLEQNRDAIEVAYGKSLNWVCQDDVRACKVYDEIKEVSIKNEEDWPAMSAFHIQRAKALLVATKQFLA